MEQKKWSEMSGAEKEKAFGKYSRYWLPIALLIGVVFYFINGLGGFVVGVLAGAVAYGTIRKLALRDVMETPGGPESGFGRSKEEGRAGA